MMASCCNDKYLLNLPCVLLLNDDNFIVPEAIEIVDTKEVIETGQRGKSTPVAKRDI